MKLWLILLLCFTSWSGWLFLVNCNAPSMVLDSKYIHVDKYQTANNEKIMLRVNELGTWKSDPVNLGYFLNEDPTLQSRLSWKFSLHDGGSAPRIRRVSPVESGSYTITVSRNSFMQIEGIFNYLEFNPKTGRFSWSKGQGVLEINYASF